MLSLFKAGYFFFYRLFDSILDLFSTRLCFACRQNFATELQEFFCVNCLAKQQLEFKQSRKLIAWQDQELLFDLEPCNYDPKIFFCRRYDEQNKKLVRAAKYRAPHYLRYMSQKLYGYFVHNIAALLADIDQDSLLRFPVTFRSKKPICIYTSYVPMHRQKIKSRVFNPSKILAQEFTFCFKASFETLFQSKQGLCIHEVESVNFLKDLFAKTVNTPALYDKSKVERVHLTKNAFTINKSILTRLDSSKINVLLIFDDITTTGTTLTSCYKLARQIRFFDEVICLAYAGAGRIKPDVDANRF